MQQSFNALVQNLRSKENEKNLAGQKLHYLKEKEKQPAKLFAAGTKSVEKILAIQFNTLNCS